MSGVLNWRFWFELHQIDDYGVRTDISKMCKHTPWTDYHGKPD